MGHLLIALVCLLLPPAARCEPDQAASLLIVPRASWSLVPPDLSVLAKLPMGPIQNLSIHHTETPVPDSVPEEQRLRNIQHFHQTTRGWGDIAYHYLIGPSGKIYEGRAEQFAASSGTVYLTRAEWEAAPQDKSGRTQAAKPPGILTPGHSAGHLTLCFLGSYGDSLPSTAARQSMILLAARKLKEFRRAPEDIYFHREIACWSDCPGQALYDWFRGPALRRGARDPGFESIASEWDRKD